MTSSKDKITRRQFLKHSVHASAAVAGASVLPGTLAGCKNANAHPYDFIIKNGLVFDGTGNPPVKTDIGIKGDKIAKVGIMDGTAAQVIDAKGLAVMPGFIDVHTHCDLTFIKTGWKRHLSWVMPSWKGNRNYISQGVTTVVTGNCGWGYSDIDQWYNTLDALGFGTNVFHLAPHGVIRQELFGPNQPGELSRAQMTKLSNRIEQEMEKGAVGMSTGLEYAPGMLADPKELTALNRIVAKYGRVYATHIRNESGVTDPSTGKVFVRQSIFGLKVLSSGPGSALRAGSDRTIPGG